MTKGQHEAASPRPDEGPATAGRAGGGGSPELEAFLRALRRAEKRGRIRLPVISETVTRVVQLMDSPDVDIDELTRCVELDPSLATKVMGVANSSYFRGASAVPNVREALMRMGVREARTIVVVVALRSTVLRAPGVGAAAQTLWRHSLLTALAAQELLAELPPWQQAGFLVGLIHDIGRIVVLGFADGLGKDAGSGGPIDAAVLEAAADSVHAELGGVVLDSWGFREDFVSAITYHHGPDGCPEPNRLLARAVCAADMLAHRVDAGWPAGSDELDPELASALEPLGIGYEAASEIAIEAAANYETLAKLG